MTRKKLRKLEEQEVQRKVRQMKKQSKTVLPTPTTEGQPAFASKQCLAPPAVRHSRTVQAERGRKPRATGGLSTSHSSHVSQDTGFLEPIVSRDNDFRRRTTLTKPSANRPCGTHDLGSDFDLEFGESAMLPDFEESRTRNTAPSEDQAITSSTSLSSQRNPNTRQYMSQKSGLSRQIMRGSDVTSQTRATSGSASSATPSEIRFNPSDSAGARQRTPHTPISTLSTPLSTQSQSSISETGAHYHNLLESDYTRRLSTLTRRSLLVFLTNECASDVVKTILKDMDTDDKRFQDAKEVVKTDIKRWKSTTKRAAFTWVEQWCQLPENTHMYDEIDPGEITSALRSQYQMHWLDALFPWATDCVSWSSCSSKGQRYLKCMCAFR